MSIPSLRSSCIAMTSSRKTTSSMPRLYPKSKSPIGIDSFPRTWMKFTIGKSEAASSGIVPDRALFSSHESKEKNDEKIEPNRIHALFSVLPGDNAGSRGLGDSRGRHGLRRQTGSRSDRQSDRGQPEHFRILAERWPLRILSPRRHL